MSFLLAPGVHACVADSRVVLLSLPSDRYWMLPTAVETTALRALRGEPVRSGDRPVLERLEARGLLRPGFDPGRSALCIHPMPVSSVVERRWQRPTFSEILRSWSSVASAMSLLRFKGLEATVDRVRASAPRPTADPDRVSVLISAFAELRFVIRPMNRCLPLSVALATRAKREDEAVRLVLGVAGSPFAAHAWVQRGSELLNDRLDSVAGFTPILVV